jgi:asparagine synthase (glutamine-hydrolysing)
VDISDVCALITLPGGKGFIIGILFHRHGPTDRVEQFSPAEIDAIERSNGQHLIERYWGTYIAVLTTAGALTIIRDPSGTLPCYYSRHQEVLYLASEPSLFIDAGLPSPKIDTSRIARALLVAGMPERATALSGIAQILPGTSLKVEGARTTIAVRWNPWSFVPLHADHPPQERADELHRTVRHCVGGWGKQYNKGVLGMSGGLDSSIVAACLHTSGNELSLLTLTTNDPLGDERLFARSLAEYLNIQMFEEPYQLEHIDLGRSSVRHLPTPAGRLDALSYDKAAVKVAAAVGANAIFTGNGGDNVFYMSHSARPLADRYSAEGLSLGLLHTLRDICIITGAPARQVIAQAIVAWRNSTKGYIWGTEESFIAREALETVSQTPVEHPWLAVPEGTRIPGKAAHIAMILRMHYSLDAYCERGGFPVVHPLASQPIQELCLQIPTWHQCAMGRDRAVARDAFKHALPLSVIERRAKGSPQGFMFEIFERFRDEICERLLDGFLVRNRVLSRSDIETALLGNRQITGAEIMRLLMFVDTEAWIEHWRRAGDSQNN